VSQSSGKCVEIIAVPVRNGDPRVHGPLKNVSGFEVNMSMSLMKPWLIKVRDHAFFASKPPIVRSPPDTAGAQ
jgi:hypothetical protein